MSNFGDHPAGFFGVSDFYNGVATQSLKFDDGSSHYLSRTVSSASNRRTFTWSGWLKRGVLDAQNVGGSSDTPIFSAGAGNNSDSDFLRFISQISASATAENNMLMLYTSISSTDYSENVIRTFRDITSWYHIVMSVDSTQGTAGNRVKFYINGVLQTSIGQYYAQVPQNYEFNFNKNVAHEIGRNAGNTARYFDGYMAEINFVDGTQYDASYFGETKNGVWIAKEPTGVTYGTEGFRLQFLQTGTGTASASTIGADTSGNDNHWTSNNLSAHDCVVDSPENNFCTLNGNILTPQTTFSEGNLFANLGATHKTVHGTFGMTTGKWYWEARAFDGGANKFTYGLTDTRNISNLQVSGTNYLLANTAATYANGDAVSIYHDSLYKNGSATGSYNTAIGDNDMVGIAFDADAGKVWFHREGTWINSDATASTTINLSKHDTTVTAGQTYHLAFAGETSDWLLNAGQDSSFNGTETAQGNTDSNGIGDFYYAVPSGFLALCSANLPELTIGPNSDTQAGDYFNTVLYSGNSSSNAISGVGFQPDWVWTKALSAVRTHSWMDSQRGFAGNGNSLTLATSGNSSNGEFENGGFDSFDSDGFTVSGSDEYMNESGDSYVAWNWQVNGGTATATASEDGNNPAYSVQANPTAGISIATYTGTNGVGTIPHGLGAIPRWVVFKNRTVDGNDWIVYHAANTAAPETDFLRLNTTALTSDNANRFNDTAPTSSVFTLGADGNINDNGESIIAYFFANVEGYSKFDSYIANGISGDGPFVFTGFRPAMIIVKNTSNNTNGGEWVILDDTRGGVGTTRKPNPILSYIEVNTSNAEFDSTAYPLVDFYSNGFKIRSDAANSGVGRATNRGNGDVYVYMAWANSPFKYANAF